MDERHEEPVEGWNDRSHVDESDATAEKAAIERDLLTGWLADPANARAFSILTAALKGIDPQPKPSRLSEVLIGLAGTLIGVLGTVVGVVFNERSSSERERQVQLREERKSAYVDLWSAGYGLVNAPVAPEEKLEESRREDRRKIEQAFGKISLFATQPVVNEAENVYGHCTFLLDTPVTRGDCKSALNRFREAVRKELELGIE